MFSIIEWKMNIGHTVLRTKTAVRSCDTPQVSHDGESSSSIWTNFWLLIVPDPWIAVKSFRIHSQWCYPQFEKLCSILFLGSLCFLYTTVVAPLSSAVSISILYLLSRALLNPLSQGLLWRGLCLSTLANDNCSVSLY